MGEPDYFNRFAHVYALAPQVASEPESRSACQTSLLCDIVGQRLSGCCLTLLLLDSRLSVSSSVREQPDGTFLWQDRVAEKRFALPRPLFFHDSSIFCCMLCCLRLSRSLLDACRPLETTTKPNESWLVCVERSPIVEHLRTVVLRTVLSR